MARDVIIRYIGDSRSAERAARNVAQANVRMSSKFGGLSASLRRFGTAAAVGLAGVGIVAVKFGSDFVKAAEDSIKVSKQTNAVLESTAGVAHVTAQGVADLSEELSKKAGVDDELVQSGANVLLTFTKVRNEVGKGNDIFTQATEVALDMSTALGQDLQSSVIQIGKALNDPIRNITALRRVGVTFSESQVEMIKKLVETGDLLGAQKVILQELTTEFGGSAEAQATASGKLAVAWDNLKEKLGTELLPVVEAFSNWMIEKGIPAIQSFAGWIKTEAVPALQDLAGWARDKVVPPLQTMATVFLEDVLPAVQEVARWIGDRLNGALETLNGLLGSNNDELEDRSTPNWQGWAVAVGVVAAGLGVLGAALTPLVPAIKAIGAAVGVVGVAFTNLSFLLTGPVGFVAILGGLAVAAWNFKDEIGRAIGTAWKSIQNFFVQGGSYIADQWRRTWDQITGTLFAWWATASAFFSALPGRLQAFFAAAGTWLLAGGKAILRGLFDGLVIGWAAWIIPWFRFIPTAVRNFFVGAGTWLLEGGKKVIGGLLRGITEKAGDIKNWFTSLPGKVWDWLGFGSPPKWAITAGHFIVEGFLKGIGDRIGSLGDLMKWLASHGFNLLAGLTQGAPGWGLSVLGVGGGSLTGLADPFEAVIRQILALGQGAVTLISGYRSHAQQQALYADYAARGFTGAPVARPGSSYHERGLAVDFGGNRALYTALAHQFGLIAPVPGEPWHWQPPGTSSGRSYYGKGGVVPGAIGAPSLAVVHGGEAIFRPDQARWLSRAGGGVTVNVSMAGAFIGSEPEAVRWVTRAVNKALEDGRINKRGRVL